MSTVKMKLARALVIELYFDNGDIPAFSLNELLKLHEGTQGTAAEAGPALVTSTEVARSTQQRPEPPLQQEVSV